MQMLKRGLALITKKRDFGLLMGVQFLGQAGDGIVQAALAKVVAFGGQEGFDLENARDPEELLRIVLYVLVPYTILSPFFGVVIDRWDRRKLLFWSNAVRAAPVALIALLGSSDVGDFPLFAAFLLTLSMTRVVLATKAAALPAALDGGSLVEGNAVSQLGGAMFQLGGAGAAIVATSVVDTDPVVLVGALVYAGAAAVALMLRKVGEVRPAATFANELKRVASNIWAGLKEVGSIPQAAASISTYFWLRLLWSFAIVCIGFSARELLADDDLQILLITGGAGAAGAVLGFVSAARLTERVRTTALLVISAAMLAGTATTVLGPFESKVSLALLTFCLGLGFFLGKISLDTMVQEALGDDFRGRAFSLYDIAYNMAWLAAAGSLKLFWEEGASGGNQGILLTFMGAAFLVGVGGLAMWFRSAGLMSTPAPSSTSAP
jgi:MFS family permease